MTRRPRRLGEVGWILVLAGLAWAGAPVAGAGQQAGQQGGQAQKQEEPVDSARLRALERLRLLGRAPGADSALFLQDSITRALDQAKGTRARGVADSTLAALMAMPGYSVTGYQGGMATFDAKNRVLVLAAGEGQKATVDREGMEVQADTGITYSEVSGRIQTEGNSTVTPPEGDAVESGALVYDLKKGVGSALGAKTAYGQQGATWYVSGDMPLAAPDSTYMSHAHFTSCNLTVPHYHFETDEIKIVGGKILVARPVRLYFADVPVAWLPFMAQSLSSGRASGLLTPTFSVNDIVRNSTGYRRRISNIGFYWAMSDYSDAILAMDWFSDNYLALDGQFNYRWRRQFLNGNLGVRRFWQANGGRQFALDTQHSWEMNERTSLRLSGRYVSDTNFLQQNSFNPAEVTQSINSEGGINRKFNWGTMSMSANRQQYLSDNRVAWTLPAVNLNLSTITLFRAPANRAHFWNNLTWGGSASLRRQTLNREQPDTFKLANADTEDRTGGLSSTINMGSLSFRQSLNFKEGLTLGVPEAFLEDPSAPVLTSGNVPMRSVSNQNLTWDMSMGYQQHLIGSTTFTPSVSISGAAFRSDTSTVASSFLSQPSRMSLTASLKTDIYGFWPGFGGFQAIRHKFSPSFDYSWTPEVTPSELQKEFFGAQAQKPQRTLTIRMNNTIEAKRKESEDTTSAPTDSIAADSLATDSTAAPAGGAAAGGPRQVQGAPTVQILGLATSVVKYDFVRRDTLNSFLAGFGTTILSNQITSDYLRGLSISVEHDLFADSLVDGRLVHRSFSPHLASLNLGFSLSSRSRIFQLLGLGGGEGGQAPQQEEPDTATEYTSRGVDESSIIPTNSARGVSGGYGGRQGVPGGSGWTANISYSMTRPRDENAPQNEMLSGSVTLHPTPAWNMSWRSSYDVQAHQFNDHFIRLTRDLHRWQANFDFVKTATGNWQFRFEVSLTDNQDLKFDYQQRNQDVGRPVTGTTQGR